MKNLKNILRNLNQSRNSSFSDEFTGGIVFGFDNVDKNKLYYDSDDRHTLIIGGTRSGKSRCIVLPSIGLMALSGESMIISDPKGELFQYTYPFLERAGYDVIAIDFKNPQKSRQYNFLQEVIDAVSADDYAKASKKAYDIAEALVPKSNGDPIWTNGEKSVLAGTIMAVVYDNRISGKYQNLTNVYHFIANMCKMGEHMPLTDYLESIPDNHPAKPLLKQSETAPSKTRGSFYISALTTLRLFADRYIYYITSENSFSVKDVGNKKTAVFMILPDEETTYYSLASLMINQIYTQLVEEADKRGGRLKRRVNFILDEFGNFAEIPDFDAKLTVGGGRGIKFHLFVQGISQLEKREKYGPETAKTIMGNCSNWIYLNSSESSVHKMISERLGKYTCKSNSQSTSYTSNYMGNTNQSSSYNLMGRTLLEPDEISRLSRPDALVLTLNYPAIMYVPDISQTVFSNMFGMGTSDDMNASKEHDRMVRLERENRREISADAENIELWGIWDLYTRKKSTAPAIKIISEDNKKGTIIYDK